MTDLTSIKNRFGIIGNSEALNRALEVALRVAPTDLSVLVTGESGVGKEFFPQVIHAYSARKHNKYIAVNCGAIPEGTIDSELFGHEKGAFTGAVEARKGYFEEADGGTIFLDEVAELPHSTQVRLLRVLQTGEFIRVGSAKVQKTNVRVVAATNTNLQDAIQAGAFPRGSLLPAQYGADPGASSAGTEGGYFLAFPQVRGRCSGPVPYAGYFSGPRGPADAGELLLAGQYPSVEKCRRTDFGHRGGAAHYACHPDEVPARTISKRSIYVDEYGLA